MAYKKLSDLPFATSLTSNDILLMTDVASNSSKKIAVSFLRQNFGLETDNILNTTSIPGTTLTDVLEYIISNITPGEQVDFASKQEIIAITSTHITQGYIQLAQNPLSPLNVRLELLQGQVQINKKAISPSSGPLTPNYDPDVNLRNRIYINNTPANFGGEGNEEHSGLSSDFQEGQILLVSYLYALGS